MFLGGRLFQLFGADTTSVRRGLAVSSPVHMEGETSLGAFRELSKEGVSGPDHIIKFLALGGPGSATLWVIILGVDGSNAAKKRRGAREFHEASDGDEGSKAGGRDL